MMQVKFDTFEMVEEFNCTLEKLFHAFVDPATKRAWYADGSHSATHDTEHYSLDARVGEREIFHFTLNEKTPVPGLKIQMQSEYIARIDRELLVQQSRMTSGGKHLSISNETFEFATRNGKSLVKLTQQGTYLEGADGPELRRRGFQLLFTNLRQFIRG